MSCDEKGGRGRRHALSTHERDARTLNSLATASAADCVGAAWNRSRYSQKHCACAAACPALGGCCCAWAVACVCARAWLCERV